MILQLLIIAIVTGSVYSLIAVGFSLTHYVLGLFNIAHAGLFLLGAFLTHFFFEITGSLLLAIPLGIVSVISIGLAIHYLIYSRLQKGVGQTGMIVGSIALFSIIQGLILLAFGENVKSYGFGLMRLVFFDLTITVAELAIVFVAVIVFVMLFILLKHSKLGVMIRAMASNKQQLALCGGNEKLIEFLVVSLSSALGAIAGILYSLEFNLSQGMATKIIFIMMAATFLPGSRRTQYVILSGLGIGLFETYLGYLLPFSLNYMLVLLLLFIILIISNRGGIASDRLRA